MVPHPPRSDKVRIGSHGMAMRGLAGRGLAWFGKAVKARLGLACQDMALRGLVMRGSQGAARLGKARQGLSRRGSHGEAWLGGARLGAAVVVRRVVDRHVSVVLGMAVEACLVWERLCAVGRCSQGVATPVELWRVEFSQGSHGELRQVVVWLGWFWCCVAS